MLKTIFIVFMGISYIEGKSTTDPHVDESTTTVLQYGNGKILKHFLMEMKTFEQK